MEKLLNISFEILTFKTRKWRVSLSSLVWRPRSGESVKIYGWNLPAKTRWIGLQYCTV